MFGGAAGVLVADDADATGGGAFGEAAGQGHGAAQGQAGLERVAAGLFHFAADEEFAVGEDADRDARVDQVVAFQAFGEQLLDFGGSLALGTHVANEGVGEDAGIVEADFLDAEVLLAEDVDADDVARGQFVGGVAFSQHSAAVEQEQAQDQAEEVTDDHVAWFLM
ncbi:hypothetical protein D3C85_1270520 [compost metagenome]